MKFHQLFELRFRGNNSASEESDSLYTTKPQLRCQFQIEFTRRMSLLWSMLGSIIRDLLVLYVDLAKFVVSERLQPNPQSFFLNLSSLPKESKHQRLLNHSKPR
jgi:hypothetical protein